MRLKTLKESIDPEAFAMLESLNELRTKAIEMGASTDRTDGFDARFRTQQQIDAYVLAMNDAIAIVESEAKW